MTLTQSQAIEAALAVWPTISMDAYVRGGGHNWQPGQPLPSVYDCSGSCYVVVRYATGLDLDLGQGWGTSESYWNQSTGGRVAVPQPGDLVYFVGSPIDPDPGHIGMCLTCDPSTGQGTYWSAYDTAEGIVVKPFMVNGGYGPNAYVGATRWANLFPADQEDILGRLVQDPVNHGWWLVALDQKAGVPTPLALSALQAQGIPSVTMTEAQLGCFQTVSWGSL